MIAGEYGLHLTPQDASMAANATHKFMNSMSYPFPFYRQALGQTVHIHHLKDDLNKTLGGFIRQEFSLWRECPDTAIAVSEEIIRRVWRRLG